MATLLLIETSTTNCSVAVSVDGQVVAEQSQNEGYSHSEKLNLFIQDVLGTSESQKSNLDAIVVGLGPGSYTGLRIGVSSAKGLAYALDIPIIGIETLEHMVQGVEEQGVVIPMLDARRMEVYTAAFQSKVRVSKTEAMIVDESSFSQYRDQDICFLGPGMEKCKEVLSMNLTAKFIDGKFPEARDMVSIAEIKYANKDFMDLAYFEPFYLKDFMATTPRKLV